MKPIFIESLGVVSPGLLGWECAKKVLNDEAVFDPKPLEKYKIALLPANERRRATEMIRLVFRVAEEATQDFLHARKDMPSVFASSGGDFYVIDQIAKALVQAEKYVSPTLFHNSVHNSASGYWGIAVQSQEASMSLSAHDHSFFAGLLEVTLQVLSENKAHLFVVYDLAPPEPLAQKRNILSAFATAFVLSPTQTEKSLAKLSINVGSADLSFKESTVSNADLEHLRFHNPAARVLPLLQALAKPSASTVFIDGMQEQSMCIEVEAC